MKYRKKLLTGELGLLVKHSILKLSETSDFSVEEIKIDKDHVHIFMRINSMYSVSQHVRKIKQITTAHIWGNFQP